MLKATRRAAGHLGAGARDRADPRRAASPSPWPRRRSSTDLTRDRGRKRAGRADACAPSCAPARRFPARWSSRRAACSGTKIVSAWGMTENGAVTRSSSTTMTSAPSPPTAGRCRAWRSRWSTIDGASAAAGRVGQAAGARLLQLRRLPEAAAPQRHRRRRLVRHRRPRAHRCARLHPHHRAQQGRDHPRRREHPGGRDRVAAVPAPGRRRWRPSWPTRTSAWASAPAPWWCRRPGQSVDLPSIVDFLKGQKVAVQYIPERLIVRDAMPSTPSGKIQKFKLRELLRAARLSAAV